MKIKRLLIYLLVLSMTITAYGKLTPQQAYKRSGGNFSLPFAGTSTARDAVPSGVWTFRDGDWWYNTTSNTWMYYESATWNAFAGGGGTTLTGAYNFGGAGVGRTIVANTGAVVITKNDTGTENQLEINATPSSSADGDGILITNNSNSTGVGIQFANSGSGNDVAGTSDTWTVSKAGAAVFVGITTTGTVNIDSADVHFDATDAGKDITWDDSEETLGFSDDAVLGFGNTAAAPDVEISHDGTSLNILDDNGDIRFGADGVGPDVKFFTEAASSFIMIDEDLNAFVLDAADISLGDGDEILFGDTLGTGDFSISDIGDVLVFTEVVDETGTISFGINNDGVDVHFYGETASAFVFWDEGNDHLLFDGVADLQISQTSQLIFIDDTDAGLAWTIDNATDDTLLFTPELTDDTAAIHFGDATNTSDLALFGLSASTVLFDASADLVTFVDYDVLYDDETILYFGTGSDFSMYSDTADTLEIDPGAAGDQFKIGTSNTDAVDVTWYSDISGAILFLDEEAASVNFGVDATGLDAVFYGDTTLLNMKWDQTNDLLTFTGGTAMLEFRGAAVDDHETTLAVVEPTKSNIVDLPDDTGSLIYIAEGGTANLSNGGTVPLTDAVVLWTSTGADGATLPDGTSAGQMLSIVLVAQSGGNATLTPTSVTGSGWATMVFTNVGESATFVYIDSTIGWLCTGTFGVSTQPLITQ